LAKGKAVVWWVGLVLLVVAAAWIAYKLYVSFTSSGGTAFEVPVYDAAVYPPILSAIGVFCLQYSSQARWPIWGYVLLWLGLTAATAGAIKILEEIGDKPLH
jgi:hypothetical protein